MIYLDDEEGPSKESKKDKKKKKDKKDKKKKRGKKAKSEHHIEDLVEGAIEDAMNKKYKYGATTKLPVAQ